VIGLRAIHSDWSKSKFLVLQFLHKGRNFIHNAELCDTNYTKPMLFFIFLMIKNSKMSP